LPPENGISRGLEIAGGMQGVIMCMCGTVVQRTCIEAWHATHNRRRWGADWLPNEHLGRWRASIACTYGKMWDRHASRHGVARGSVHEHYYLWGDYLHMPRYVSTSSGHLGTKQAYSMYMYSQTNLNLRCRVDCDCNKQLTLNLMHATWI
jgi:hypothetical protein